MKKIIMGAILLLLGNLTFAQVEWGVKAGINRNTISKSSVNPDPEALVGLNAGVLAFIPIDKKLQLRAEIQYTGKGFKKPPSTSIAPNGLPFLGRRTNSQHYISVPLLLSYSPIKKISFMAGPELSHILKAEETGDGPKKDLTKSINKWDISMDLGVAYNFTKKLGVELRYCHGLNRTQTYMLVDGMENFLGMMDFNKTRVFQAGLFYRFSRK